MRGDLAAARRHDLRACSDQSNLIGCRAYATLLADACRAHDATSCQELDQFFASLPARMRPLAALDCCRDRLDMAASPTVQMAMFSEAHN